MAPTRRTLLKTIGALMVSGPSVIEPSALRDMLPAWLAWNRVTIERTLSSGLSVSNSDRSSALFGGAVITMRTAGSSASRIVTLAPGGRMSSTAAAYISLG